MRDWHKLVPIALEHGTDGLADGRGVDFVVRGEPESKIAYTAPGAVDQDDLAGIEFLGYAEQLVLGAVRGETDPFDPPLLLLALGAVCAVGCGGVGGQDDGVLRTLLQSLAVESARPALHRYRRGDDGAGVRKNALARLVVVGDGPDVLGEEDLTRITVLEVGLHIPELLGVEPFGGRHHGTVDVDEDFFVQAVLPTVVLDAEDDLLRLSEGVGRDQDRPTPLQRRIVYDLDHRPDRLGEWLWLLVGQRRLHDEEVYIPDLGKSGRGD